MEATVIAAHRVNATMAGRFVPKAGRTVYVASRSPVILVRELRLGCLGYAEVRALSDGSRATVPASGDVLVVEAVRPPAFLVAGTSLHVRRGVRVRLVIPRETPVPRWVAQALPSLTTTIACDPAVRDYGFARAAVVVARLVGAPTGAQVAEAIVATQPRLRPLADLVRAICEDPWVVRRPRDLAVLVGATRTDLIRRCARAGFSRAEYLIAVVRAELFRCLSESHGRRPMAACQLSGIGDRTNFRRVVARAKLRTEWMDR